MSNIKLNSVMKSKIFFILVLSFLFPLFNVQAINYPVVWTPEKIEQTLGFEGTIDIPTTFISSVKLNNVNLWVVPELQPFVRLEPQHFESIIANTPYEVIVHLSVPNGTYPGLYDGTIHIRAGTKIYPQTLKIELNIFYENVSIPSTTKVLDESTMRYLSLISADGSTLTFSEIIPELESLSPGDVIVIGITPITPNGLLRKVTNVSISNNQVVVETIQATLEDAIEDGTIEFNKILTPNDLSNATALRQGVSFESMLSNLPLEGFYLEINDVVLYDDDGNLDTTNDQIRANGSISLNPGFVFNMKIEDFELKQLTFTNTITETLEVEVEAKAEILDIEKKVEIARYAFTPIIVWVGWLPVIITPNLTVNVGLDGEVSVGIETSVTQEANLTAGLTFDNGTWSPITDFSNSFQWDPPMLSAGCNFKGYAGPQLNLLIYSLAGPYAEIDGYLELDADLFRVPWWKLYGGIEAGVGIRVEIFSHQITDYYLPAVIGYRFLLAQADIPTQGVISGGVKDAITQSPLEDVSINVYSQSSLISTGTTNSNGTYSLSVLSGSGYRVEFSKAGYLPAIYYNVSVEDNTTTYLEVVLQIDTAHSGTGNVSGRILNALNGIGVSDLTVNLREGINVTTGTIVAITSTGINGSYSFTNLDAGNYTAEASGTGYNTTYFTIICIGGATTANQDATITPILSSGETRIILTWGATPSDLDSHLTGPLPDGTRFHMFYPYAEANWGSPWPEYVTLDLDDITSYGPETTTILRQINGIYRYSVHDYTNRYSSSSTALSNSSAQVRVYRGIDFVATYNVPSNQGGTLWTVFELSGDTITPVNTMSYESNPASIQSIFGIGTIETDAPLMMNLPPKR